MPACLIAIRGHFVEISVEQRNEHYRLPWTKTTQMMRNFTSDTLHNILGDLTAYRLITGSRTDIVFFVTDRELTKLSKFRYYTVSHQPKGFLHALKRFIRRIF